MRWTTALEMSSSVAISVIPRVAPWLVVKSIKTSMARSTLVVLPRDFARAGSRVERLVLIPPPF